MFRRFLCRRRPGELFPRHRAQPDPEGRIDHRPQRVQAEELSHWHPVPAGKKENPEPHGRNEPAKKDRLGPVFLIKVPNLLLVLFRKHPRPDPGAEKPFSPASP